jgi:hypothetical protein
MGLKIYVPSAGKYYGQAQQEKVQSIKKRKKDPQNYESPKITTMEGY